MPYPCQPALSHLGARPCQRAAVKLIGKHGVSLVADPEAHQRQRALLQPFFSPDAVAAMMPRMQETVRADGGATGRGAPGMKTPAPPLQKPGSQRPLPTQQRAGPPASPAPPRAPHRPSGAPLRGRVARGLCGWGILPHLRRHEALHIRGVVQPGAASVLSRDWAGPGIRRTANCLASQRQLPRAEPRRAALAGPPACAPARPCAGCTKRLRALRTHPPRAGAAAWAGGGRGREPLSALPSLA
jgi:hypothetical protein